VHAGCAETHAAAMHMPVIMDATMRVFTRVLRRVQIGL
jgi:hypothetical protein